MANHRKAYLEITNVCNLACAFCPGTSRKHGRLDMPGFTFLAKRLSGWAEYLFFHLMGEPTAHPLLPDFINYASELGMKSIITTNGTLLSTRADALIAAKPHKVSISLHAFEANTAGMPQGLTFERYISDCLEFSEKAAEGGIIAVLRLWNLDGRADGALNEQNDKVLKMLHSHFPNEWHTIRSGQKLCERVFLEWGEKFDWPMPDGEIRGDEGFCYALRDQIGVLCDGTVVPCCLDRNGDISLGNLYESTLDEILGSPRAKAIYDGFTAHRCTEELCRRCMRAEYYRK